MIATRYIEEWKTYAPWPDNAQVEQKILLLKERGDKPISIKYLKPYSKIFEVGLKDIQNQFIADAIGQ